VTFVFTDIEDSTEHLKRLGDAYADVLSAHRRIVRDTFRAREGVEIDTQGDAFFYVFRRARDAVTAAVDAQRDHASADWPGDGAIRVRMGLHTGEPAVHEEGYVGLDVVRAARICTLGRGGQILLSETTRALLGSGLPDGVSVFPLGQHHLRGIDEPERVFEIAIEDLPHDEAAAFPEAEDDRVPPPAVPDVAVGAEDFGTRLAASIQDRVARALGGRAAPQRTEDGSGVDHIAAHMAALGDEIDARIRDALARAGVGDEDD
jgi:class 3 adenylate cyclase